MTTSPAIPRRPASATHGGVAAAGLATFVAASALVRVSAPSPGEITAAAGCVIAVTTLAVLLADAGWQRTWRRASTGLDFSRDEPSLARAAIKWLGLLASIGFIGVLYALFPEYRSPFYGRYWALLRVLVPALVLLAPAYLYAVDRRQREPRDGLYQFGALLLGRRGPVDPEAVSQHLLGWLIKGFFLPLMFTYFCNDLERLVRHGPLQFARFADFYDFAYDYLYFIDVGLVSMGYLAALRLFDTHLRSAEPTVLGWAAALVCYEPFWSLVGDRFFAYGSGTPWGVWFATRPLLYTAWGSTILLLTAVYVWATVSFGARFSNLTHRGIITNGPYRYLRHPAYVAKNLSWWMISVPFLAHDSVFAALRRCLLLLALNGVYALRAWTEERHLARDPDYVAYREWVRRDGLVARLRRLVARR